MAESGLLHSPRKRTASGRGPAGSNPALSAIFRVARHKVRQRTVTPSGRPTLGSIPRQPTIFKGSVAQMVEQRTLNPRVVGSIPTRFTIFVRSRLKRLAVHIYTYVCMTDGDSDAFLPTERSRRHRKDMCQPVLMKKDMSLIHNVADRRCSIPVVVHQAVVTIINARSAVTMFG